MTTEDVLDLLSLLVEPADPFDRIGAASLIDLGVSDDLTVLDLWDATVEEYGERTLGDVDLDAAREATNLRELAAVFAANCRRRDADGQATRRGDRP